MERSPYEVLGVRPDDPLDVIRAAWRTRIRAVHPDRGGDPAEAAAVNAAWELLSDPVRRARYDLRRETVGRSWAADPDGVRPVAADVDLDPTPTGAVPPPRVLTVGTVAAAAASLALLAVGMVIPRPALGLAVMSGAVAALGFVAAPLWAMTRARSATGRRR